MRYRVPSRSAHSAWIGSASTSVCTETAFVFRFAHTASPSMSEPQMAQTCAASAFGPVASCLALASSLARVSTRLMQSEAAAHLMTGPSAPTTSTSFALIEPQIEHSAGTSGPGWPGLGS